MSAISPRSAGASDAPAPSRAPLFLVILAVVAVAAALMLAFELAGDVPRDLGDGLFVADATARLFALLINLVFLGIAVHIWTRTHGEGPLSRGTAKYVGFTALFMLCGNLAIFSGHLVGYWIFLEATTLAAVPLIQHGGSARALRASWRYFLFSGVGLSLALLGSACLARYAEHATFAGLAGDGLIDVAGPADVWRRLGLGLWLLGLGTKLGLAPMYTWLPETYDAAPPPTTALLAAVQFNVALVGVLRVLGALRDRDPTLISMELIAVGMMTMAISALHIVVTRSFTKLVAYASLNHAGVIVIGLGAGGRAAYGVVLYAVGNALVKAVLFLTAGTIRTHYETENVREVSGLVKDLPYTGIFFMVGIFALLGFPPFCSFVGELLIMSGLMRAGFVVVFVAFCAILTVTFVATGRALFPMIWGEAKKPVQWGDQLFLPLLPKVAFLGALIALGVYIPAPLHGLLQEVATAFGGVE